MKATQITLSIYLENEIKNYLVRPELSCGIVAAFFRRADRRADEKKPISELSSETIDAYRKELNEFART